MTKIKMYLDNFMESLKNENPNASWTNLLTGLGILVLVSTFSIWYFGNNVTSPFSSSNDSNESDATNLSDPSINSGEENDNVQTIIVEQSEGLWQVADRVCEDGELYDEIARENNIQLWEPLFVGQELKVTCTNTSVFQEIVE